MAERSILAQLALVRFRHFRLTLQERALRLRQNALIAAGILGVALVPFILLVLQPARVLLQDYRAAPVMAAVVFFQLLSWMLFLLQREALISRRAERYLSTWPLSGSNRQRLNVLMAVVANHLVWVISLPSFGWYLFAAGAWPEAAAACLKLAGLYYLMVALQARYLEKGLLPGMEWLGLNAAYLAVVLLAQYSGQALAYLALGALPLLLQRVRWPHLDFLTGWVTEALIGLRTRIMRAAPWHSLHVLLICSKQASAQVWRPLLVVLLAIGSSFILRRLSGSSAVLALLAILFTAIYVVNGVYYFFDDMHRNARLLLRSWGASSRMLRRKVFLLLFAFDLLFVLPTLAIAVAGQYIDLSQALYAGFSSVALIPVVFLIGIKSSENVLSFSMLAWFPVCIGALILFH